MTTCSICLEEKEISDRDSFILEDCGHQFHIKCIMEWFRKGHKTCPLCRSRPEEPDVIPQTNSNAEDDYVRNGFQALLNVLENSQYQDQYRKLQTLFQTYNTMYNVDRKFALELTKIVVSLFSFKIKLQVFSSLFLAGTFSIIITPILITKIIFDEMIDYISRKITSRSTAHHRPFIIRRVDLDETQRQNIEAIFRRSMQNED